MSSIQTFNGQDRGWRSGTRQERARQADALTAEGIRRIQFGEHTWLDSTTVKVDARCHGGEAARPLPEPATAGLIWPASR